MRVSPSSAACPPEQARRSVHGIPAEEPHGSESITSCHGGVFGLGSVLQPSSFAYARISRTRVSELGCVDRNSGISIVESCCSFSKNPAVPSAA